jgi:hypothetical protein
VQRVVGVAVGERRIALAQRGDQRVVETFGISVDELTPRLDVPLIP